MNGFGLLSKEQVFEKNNFGLGISKAALADFAILAGAATKNKNSCDYDGYWWLKDLTKDCKSVECIDPDGKVINLPAGSMINAVRPVINYSKIKPYSKEKNYLEMGKMVIAGEYPQFIVNPSLSYKLEQEFQNGHLLPINQTFTTCEEIKNSGMYVPVKNDVYLYNNKKYIRYEANNAFYVKCYSGNREIYKWDAYWVEVEPIEWLVDEENDLAISYFLLLGGIPFDDVRLEQPAKEFEDSFLKQFLDVYFANDILPKGALQKSYVVEDEEDIKNVYGFDLSKVTEEEIIRGAVDSNISVFLHGKSSDGKSARIKNLDPDCEIIYMRNATPDSLNGKSVYDASTGTMIDVPPSWYKKIVDKCSKEPDKVHLVFFDELTNALPSMQGMAFNIILDREVNGKWKLPKNARIVAAGNDYKDSLAANKMAEPLFNRFAHIYINTEVEDWLKWAMEEDNSQRLDYEEFDCEQRIHPAIISYIENRVSQGFNVLRTDFNGITPNADPRKWEMASKVLYKTNKPEMLRALIGEELTLDFVMFIKREAKVKVK